MIDIYQDRQEKHRLLCEAGHHVVSIRECDWKRQ